MCPILLRRQIIKEEVHGIEANAIVPDLIMEMRTADQPRFTALADEFAAFDPLTFPDK